MAIDACHGAPFFQQITPVQQNIRNVIDALGPIQPTADGKRQTIAMHLGPDTRRDRAASGEIMDVSVGEGAGELSLDDADIVIGGTVTVNTFTITQPA